MPQPKKKKGFTFIEILVVVTIIGIITSMGMVMYTEFVKQSRDAKRKGDLENMRGALEMYKSKNNLYPTSIPSSNGLLFGTGDLCDVPDCSSGGIYLKKLPNDPKNPTYNYYYSSSGSSDYVLGTYLEKGSSSNCGNNCGAICNYCMGPYGQL